MKRLYYAAIALACALSACGGGGNSGESKVDVGNVKVVGASLADSGTFGFKFTVQSSTGTPSQVYTERIAATYGLGMCNHYNSHTGGLSYDASNNACYNYAVAGSAINFGVLTDGNSDTVKETFTAVGAAPTNQLFQLTQLGALTWSASDLLIVGEGSANDTATLITAYLTDAQTAGTLNTTVFKQVINSLMADGGVTAGAGVLATDKGTAAGVAYMTKLAQTLVASVKTHALDKGAKRVVVINTLDVTRTPKLQAVLAGLPTLQAAQLQGLFRAWIQAYNAALNAAVAPYAGKVYVVDLYTNFNAELDDPAQFGLSNITNTVCDEVVNNGGTTSVATAGTTALSTPSTVAACTTSAASAITPHQNGGSSTWWQGYLFADNFHPTPYGHQLLAQLVAKRLTEAGWL
jgi:outer membrane lipase/esterase